MNNCSDNNPILELDDSIMPYLGKANKYADIFVCQEFKANGFDLTRQQFILLKILNQQKCVAQGDLAFLTSRDKTSLTRLISTMQRKGLVIREGSETDRRSKLIKLTTQGKEVFENLTPKMRGIISEIVEGIDKDELEIAKKVLDKIRENSINKLQ